VENKPIRVDDGVSEPAERHLLSWDKEEQFEVHRNRRPRSTPNDASSLIQQGSRLL
jgi:hypothetical protein